MHFLLLVIAGLVLWPILHRVRALRREKVVCRNCGTVAQPVTESPRHLLLEIILWFSGLFPGVIYTLWCTHHTYEVCSKCRSRDIVPVDSPVGRKMAGGEPTTHATPMSEELRRK